MQKNLTVNILSFINHILFIFAVKKKRFYMLLPETKETEIKKILWKRPLIISGPCSAETEEQVLLTASQLVGTADIYRAGIWKPRTRPDNFEGIGTSALKWLQNVKRKAGIPVAVEVLSAKQVDEILKHNIDVIWIGARSTVNPVSVQDIANALKGVEIPVLIKNPLNPNLELWIGAVERIAKSGISTIGLIHRGFSTYGNTDYRNAPMWHLAIEMKREYPDLMMICDPSHICGKRETLLPTSQKAIDLDYDGLMIESHIDPDNAWSDSKQQITPAELKSLLHKIIWRKESSDKEEFNYALEKIREQIDQLDDELLQLLSKRMRLADKIGEYKKENNITILQTNRWNKILKKAMRDMQKLGLSEEFIKKYFDAIHLESINHQNNIMNS